MGCWRGCTTRFHGLGLKALTHIQPRLHIFALVHGGGLMAKREADSGLGLPLVAVLPIKAQACAVNAGFVAATEAVPFVSNKLGLGGIDIDFAQQLVAGAVEQVLTQLGDGVITGTAP